MPSVQFYSQDIPFVFKNKLKVKSWLKAAIKEENKILGNISCIFCSDVYLHEMNVKYLQHDTFTDIITFDYTENNIISGDLFISIDRVRENALTLNTTFLNELHRVIIHGTLHLCGYKDKKKADALEIRAKEDFYLQKIDNQ